MGQIVFSKLADGVCRLADVNYSLNEVMSFVNSDGYPGAFLGMQFKFANGRNEKVDKYLKSIFSV